MSQVSRGDACKQALSGRVMACIGFIDKGSTKAELLNELPMRSTTTMAIRDWLNYRFAAGSDNDYRLAHTSTAKFTCAYKLSAAGSSMQRSL